MAIAGDLEKCKHLRLRVVRLILSVVVVVLKVKHSKKVNTIRILENKYKIFVNDRKQKYDKKKFNFENWRHHSSFF